MLLQADIKTAHLQCKQTRIIPAQCSSVQVVSLEVGRNLGLGTVAVGEQLLLVLWNGKTSQDWKSDIAESKSC